MKRALVQEAVALEQACDRRQRCSRWKPFLVGLLRPFHIIVELRPGPAALQKCGSCRPRRLEKSEVAAWGGLEPHTRVPVLVLLDGHLPWSLAQREVSN